MSRRCTAQARWQSPRAAASEPVGESEGRSPNEKPGAPARTGTLVNAQGAEEANVWGKRSEWVDYSGQIGYAQTKVSSPDQ